jgi:4-hydroxybenzoyl-CoA thioesterase
MIVFERPVGFEEVDAAGILFFGRFFTLCHDAMEHFFSALPNGYVDLIMRRRIGFPAVHVTADFRAPLAYGDVARIEVTVPRVGSTSCTFRYVFQRLADGAPIARIEHVVVAMDLATRKKTPLPADCRALLEAHPH